MSSSNKYIPPNKRNADTSATMPNQQNRRPYRKPQWEIAEEQRLLKEQARLSAEEDRRKNIEFTENNFPSLVAPATKVTICDRSKSFAALAVEWDEKSKQEDLQQEEEPVQVFRRRNAMPLPQFHNVHRFIEPEDDDYEPESKLRVQEDDEWVTVDRRKYRRQKTIEEKLARPPTPENDGSVWNDGMQETGDTCWDE